MVLPHKNIQGFPVKDYAFLWSKDACSLQQWCSGARGIDDGVIFYTEGLIRQLRPTLSKEDLNGLQDLLSYLVANKGANAEAYIPS